MTSITVKEFFAVEGSFLSNKDAKKIGPVLDELSKQGALTARDVVDAAHSQNSPLHEYFEWEDRVAADHYRVETARRMLRSVKIKFIEEESTPTGIRRTILRETRAFQTMQRSAYETGARTYRTFEVLHGDSAFAAQMMDSALDDLTRWRTKYEPYIQMWKNFGDTFQAVINQISEWEEEFPTSTQAAGATDVAMRELLEWRETNSAVLATWTNCREQVEFIMNAIRDAEVMFAQLSERKHRDCLRCGKSFISVSAGNRICASCLGLKSVNENADHMDGTIAG